MKKILIKRSVIDSLLSYAKACHPKEGILLLIFVVKPEVSSWPNHAYLYPVFSEGTVSGLSRKENP